MFVPLALPGEDWRRGATGFALAGPASADRQAPPCPHFIACGGCVAQHMAPALYARWKRQILVDALQKADINGAVAPLRSLAPGSRRRVVLSALQLPAGVTLGFHARASDRLVDIEACTIAEPMIVAALGLLRQVAARLVQRREELRLTVTRVDDGLDVAAEGARSGLGAADRAGIAELIARGPVLRLSVNGDPILTRAAPVLTIAGAPVVPPPGVFLQASSAAQDAMIDLVAGAVGKAKDVVDLFSGLGTFTLPLARRARVLAIDSDSAALGALDAAARNARGLKPIETRQRDLMREPLSRKELEGFAAAVFDPPRAGAESQAGMLARSAVPVVVAVSCNPTTLARDAAILLDGGYALKQVTPIDQFLFSPHLEAVAVFERPPPKRRKPA